MQELFRIGVQIGDHTIIGPLVTMDDEVIITQDQDDMESVLRKFKEEYKRWGLPIDYQKTKYIFIRNRRRIFTQIIRKHTNVNV